MAINECGLQAADANRAVIRYLKEADNCWGVTPASGTSREMRITSSALTAEKETVVSNELRADRMVSDIVEVAATSGGEVNIEFSAGSLDDFMQAFLLGLWTRPMTFDKFEGTVVSWTAADNLRVSGGDFTGYFIVGRRIKTEGFINPKNNNYFEVEAVAFSGGNTNITVTVGSAIVEAGSSFTKVIDANDVIILNNGTIRAGTAGAQAFDSNGGNAFTTAVTAEQLVVGQKIYVSGLGYEEGFYAFSGQPADEDTVTVFDGDKTVVYEFDDDAAFTRGRTGVTIGATAADTVKNLADAINLTLWQRKVQASAIAAVEVGTILMTDVPDDADELTIDDGVVVSPLAFEFDSGGGVAGGKVPVTIGATAAATAVNLCAAINNSVLDVTARVSGATVTVWAHNIDGAIVEVVDVGVSMTITDFSSLNQVHVRNLRGDQAGTLTENATNVTVTDFTGDQITAHGVFTLTAVTNDVLSVAESVATHANAGAIAVTIKGSHLRNPGDLEDITPQSFTIETGFSDVEQYFVQTGMRVGTFGLSLSSGEIVTGTIEFMGKETTPQQLSLLGESPYTVLDSTATSVMNSTTNVGNVYKNGEILATAVQSLEINGEATLRNQTAVSSKFPAGVAAGRFNLTGTITSYFETLEMYEHFINHETISLGFDFSDNDRNYYFFSIPAVIITTDPIAPGGIDQDVVEEMEWAAKRDPVLRTMFMIDRFSSLLPATV
jgi:hypothetical protein